MSLKRYYPRFILLILIFILFILFTQRQNIEYYLRRFSVIVSIIKQNIETQANPPRKFVGNKLQKEDELKMYVGEPFRSFSYADWEDFWRIIYGVYKKENPQDPDLPDIYRHLDQEEMQYELVKRYPQPFAYFQESQWKAFWQMIFSK